MSADMGAPRAFLTPTIAILAVLCALQLLPTAHGFVRQSLILNGSFEYFRHDNYYVSNGLCASSDGNSQYDCANSIGDLYPWWWLYTISFYYNRTGLPCSDGLGCINLHGSETSWPGMPAYSLFSLQPGETYFISYDLGGEVASCATCLGTVTDLRNVSVMVLEQGAPGPFYEAVATLDLTDGRCKFMPINLTFTAPSTWLEVYFHSLSPLGNCGPLIDNVQMYWLPCLTGTPPVSDPRYQVVCADGWIVTPPPSAAPIAITGPIIIAGSVDILDVNVTIGNLSISAPLIRVPDGNITIFGILTIEIGAQTATDTVVNIVNASSVSANVTAVVITRSGVPVCHESRVLQTDNTLAVLVQVTPCQGKAGGSGLKHWQLALIAVGAAVVGVLLMVGVVIIGRMLLKRRKRRRDMVLHFG